MKKIGINKNSGYDCWLVYNKITDQELKNGYSELARSIVLQEDSEIIMNAVHELKTGLAGMLEILPGVTGTPVKKSYILLGTFSGNPNIDSFLERKEIDATGDEGFIIKPVIKPDSKIIVIAGKTDKGVLYGVYNFLRAVGTLIKPEKTGRCENPVNGLRIINHWDNMDGSIERGYAGKSIFYKNNKVLKNSSRIRDYARLLSSISINGIVLNNVNVHKYETGLITSKGLKDVAKLAEVFRSYGIKTFLSVNYASSMELGALKTADPLDAGVKKWWKQKVDEIYKIIPDFGGFLVKADSEGRPGPFTYGRNHADGANMLAEALKPHGGLVFWRCFVYNCQQDWRDYITDRARAAYDHFMPLDGTFHDNVLLQIKNGPMDFQVREPVSPLFGGLKATNMAMEFQITQEYTGQQKHLCYLVPMWKEILDFDTYTGSKGTTVKQIVSGSIHKNKFGGIAAVVNIGDDKNWTGLQLAQSNLYGYGRLCWNPELGAEEIALEWIKQTFSNDAEVEKIISEMLLNSWKIYENYTSPLGIGWMVNPNHHFGPSVDGYEYSRWGTYHRADTKGIGVDRTIKAGTGYTGQYNKEISEMYDNIESCPEELLLFFHHVPYNYRLKTGMTLLQHIYNSHFLGVEQAMEMQKQWLKLKGRVSDEIFEHVNERLNGQIEHACEWRDVVNSYFFRKTGIADEKGRKIY